MTLTREIPISVVGEALGQAFVRDNTGRFRNRRLGFWDVTWSGAIPYADGTAYASMAYDSAQDIRDAVTQAKALGVPVVGRGTYRVDSLVTIDCNHDFQGTTFVCNDTALSPLVRIGTATSGSLISWIKGYAPNCIQAAKTGTGWTGVSVGIELSNLYRSEIHLGRYRNFTTGIRYTTAGAIGSVYLECIGGHADNNKINLHLNPGSGSGWTNQCQWRGLSCSHDSAEGTLASGTRHILLSGVGASQPNGNVFDACSLESPGVVEYEVESVGGIFNTWRDCRWEHTGGNARIFWNEVDASRFSRDSYVEGGYSAGLITHSYSTNSKRVNLRTEQKATFHGLSATISAIRVGNATSDIGPQIEGVDLSVDPNQSDGTDWRWRITAAALAVKAKADTVARWSISTALGVLSWSDGSAAADTNLYRNGPNQLKTDDRFIAADGVTPKVKAGVIADGDFASTPADGTMGVDTTNSKIMVRIGGAWRSVVVS